MGLTAKTALSEDDEDEWARSILVLLEQEATTDYLEDSDAEPNNRRDNDLPAWFDETRFKRGAAVFEKNIFIMFAGKLSGLVTLLAIPSIVEVLELTKQSGEPHKAFRRYVDTIRHMLFWYRECITDPKSKARESLAIVRRHHLRATMAARRAGLPGISQFDMAITQFAFCGYVVLRRKILRLDASDDELQDFLHVWRTLGFLIGIKDKYNICQCDEHVEITCTLLECICKKWLVPYLTSPPRQFTRMSQSLLDGTWCMMPILEYTSFVHFTQELAGIPSQQCLQPPTVFSSIMLSFLHCVPASLGWPVIGSLFKAYHNANMRFSLYMSTYYPLLAWYSFPGNSSTRYHKLLSTEE